MSIIKVIGLTAEEVRQFQAICVRNGRRMAAVLRDYVREVIRNDKI